MERLTVDHPWMYYSCDFKDDLDKAAEMANRLKAYEDASEQGLLFKMPIAIGDTFFEVSENHHGKLGIHEWTVKGYNFTADSTYICAHDYVLINSENIGKTVFRTMEEAQAKLKELEAEHEK